MRLHQPDDLQESDLEEDQSPDGTSEHKSTKQNNSDTNTGTGIRIECLKLSYH